MPLKNLNLVEKYLEKAVLAIGVLFAILVTWLYVLGSPYSVEMGTLRKTLKPDEIEPKILEELKKLERDLRIEAASQMPPMRVPAYTEEFRKRHGSPLLDTDRLELPFGEFGLTSGLFDTTRGPADSEYYIPTPPQPVALKYGTGFGVLAEPKDRNLVVAFEDMIGSQVPRDFTWVSVSAEFDLKTWRQLLTSRPPKDFKVIPEQWWRSHQIIGDVVLLKQIYDVEQGKWGEVVTLPHVPGNELFAFFGNEPLSFRAGRANWAPAEADEAIKIAMDNDGRLARPPFPTLSEGLWLPPDADPNIMAPDDREKLAELTEKIKVLQKEIKAARENPRAAADPGPGKVAVDVKSLQSQLDRTLHELYVLVGVEEEEVAAGVEVVPQPGVGQPAVGGPDGDQPEVEEEIGRDTIKVWQHDITVKPGQTVRYSMVASVVSPVFHQSSLSATQRNDFYNKLTLASVQSAWTEPILVQSEHAFFLASSDSNREQVTLEVFCIFNGQWQMEEFVVSPGDPVGGLVKMSAGGAERTVNMNVGALLIDIDFEAPAKEGIAGSKTTRIIYYDQATGALLERYLDEDKNSLKRVELRKKALSNRVAGL